MDPYSRYFVCHPALRALLIHRLPAGAALRAFDWLWGGLHAHIVLRVRYADDVCEAAIRDGIDQVVLLGAGFDTTGFRRGESGVRIFEVDAPATQSDKRSLAERLPPPQRNHETTWVPCDFEKDALQERLVSNGFEPTRPSIVVWLGVTMYLTAAAIDKTLSDLAALCASGSRLVVDYIDADVTTPNPRWKSAGRVTRFVARRGEPYRSGFTTASLDALFAVHGFKVREHVSVPALLERYDSEGVRRLAGDDWLGIAAAERI